MKADTKIYSDFIKRNGVTVSMYEFTFVSNGKKHTRTVYKSGSLWYVENDDASHTKSAAIYWHIKNNFNVQDGTIA